MDVLFVIWAVTGIAIVGCLLISFYFWRKEAFVENLHSKLKGITDA